MIRYNYLLRKMAMIYIYIIFYIQYLKLDVLLGVFEFYSSHNVVKIVPLKI